MITRKLGLGLILVVALLLVAAIFALDSIVKQSINTGAPKLLGVKTHVEMVSIRPFRGIVHLKNLTLANPEGYTTNHWLFAVNEFYVNIKMTSIFKETIEIHKILINGPGFTYEFRNGISNIDALIAQINKGKSANQENKEVSGTPQQPQAKKAGKKVIIEELSVNGTKLAYSGTVTGGRFLPIPIVPITLKDIGKQNGGIAIADALVLVFNEIITCFSSAITGAGDLISSAAGSGLKGATDATKASADAVDTGVKETTKAVGSALDEVGGLFKTKKK